MTDPKALADRLDAWSRDDTLGDGMLLRKAAQALRDQAAALSTERHCYKTMKRQRDQLQARVAELEALKDD